MSSGFFSVEKLGLCKTKFEALSGWGSGKVFLDIIFKIQENLIVMISNTIEMLFIVYSNTLCFFPYVNLFTLIYGPFLVALLMLF